MKTCKVCSVELTEENKSNGLKCKECYRAYMREWQKKNRKKVTASHYRWIKNNPERNRETVYRWREKNKEHYNEYQRIYQKTWKKKNNEND